MGLFKKIVVASCLLGFYGAACAGPIPLKWGAWKLQMEMPGVPAKVEAMMNHALPEACFGPGMRTPPQSPQSLAMHCRTLHSSGNLSFWQATEFCPASAHSPALTVHWSMRVAADHQSYVQTSRVIRGPGADMPASVIKGTWAGPKCPVSVSKPMLVTPMTASN